MTLAADDEHAGANRHVDPGIEAMPCLITHSRTKRRHTTPFTLLLGSLFFLVSGVASYGASLETCIHAKDTADAIRECTALSQSDGLSNQDNIALHLRRGQAWLDDEDPAEAVKDFTLVLEIDGHNEQARVLRARANTALGQHGAASSDWSALIETTQSDAMKEQGHLMRAASWLAAGNFEAALADYDAVLAANAKSVKACLGRANVFVARNDREKALQEFARAMAIDPNDTTPYIARAEAAERWGDTKSAIEDYKVVVQNNTRSAGPYRKALQRLGVDTPP